MAIGVDIGTTSIKIVSTVKQKGVFRLVSAGAARAPLRGMDSEAEGDLVAVAQTVKKLFSEAKIVGKEVIVSVPESQVVTRVVSMPALSDQELASAIEWEAEQYIPMPISEANVAYEVVDRPKEGVAQMKVLLVAVAKRLVDKYVRVLGMAGLKVVAVETDMLALSRSLVPAGAGTTLVVDMGARGTDMAVVSRGRVVFTRSISTAGEALTRAVAVGLSMEVAQAEEYKKAYGLSPNQLEGKVRAVLLPVFEIIASEMRKSIEFYRSQEPADPVKAVILSGGTAGIPELVSELAGRLGMEVVVGDSFAALAKEEKAAAALAGYAPLYSIAVGLSLKES